MIKDMHHTGFVVSDLERAVAFYRDVIGMEVTSRYERIGPGVESVVGYKGAHLKIALMGAGGVHALELIKYLSPFRPSGRRTSAACWEPPTWLSRSTTSPSSSRLR